MSSRNGNCTVCKMDKSIFQEIMCQVYNDPLFTHFKIIFAKKKLWELYSSTRKNNFHPHKLVTVNSLLVNVYQFSQNKEFNEYLSLNIDEDPHIYVSMKTLFILKLQKLAWTNLNVSTVSKSANQERQKPRLRVDAAE
jgi:hypothetical protein